jgi:GT2 family glycosyltransferase
VHADLAVLLVDNASDTPLDTIETPPGLALTHLRLDANVGGSGGFNAGMLAALDVTNPDDPNPDDDNTFLWLIDSDARVEPDALNALLDVARHEPDAAVVGSMFCEPDTGEQFELGGRVDRTTGEYTQFVPTPSQLEQPDRAVDVEYVAACSMIVRAGAARRSGLMADLFVNGDDIEWCLRLARQTGGRILACPASRVRHPKPNRMRTWDRAYVGRNAFAVIDALGLGARTRFVRTIREVGRALAQTLVGRDDLAMLHMRSLADARYGRVNSRSDATFTPFQPLDALPEELLGILCPTLGSSAGGRAVEIVGEIGLNDSARERLITQLESLGVRVERAAPTSGLSAILGALGRLGPGRRARVAIVSARANPCDWLAGQTLVTVCPQGFAIATIRRADRACAALALLVRGLGHALALARCGPGARPDIVWPNPIANTPALAIIVLSYNRKDALVRTIDALLHDTFTDTEILVVDNGSSDGSADTVREHFDDPRLRVLALDDNLGVEAFNRGVAATRAPYVLILDDDARPGEGVLDEAMTMLRSRPDLAAVALHPKHPATGESEWPFAGDSVRDDWPVMGCGNIVRRDAWQRVDGYESRFFLYRNDVDLALKLGDLRRDGKGVYFDPNLVVWHDSPAAAKKSLRWYEGATRNWVWLCRRHGRGAWAMIGVCMGWVWAHRLAGTSPRAHIRVLKGALGGLAKAPPTMPSRTPRDGHALRALLRLRFGR